MAWTSSIVDYILDQAWGYQGANKIKNNIIAIASARLTYFLGGSRVQSVPQVAAAQDAINWIDIELNGTNLTGFTIALRVEVRSAAVGTSVTPKLRNVTDSTDAGTGVAVTAINADYSGTNQKQTITCTIAAGVKKYRLMLTPSNTTNPVFGIGYLEIYGA